MTYMIWNNDDCTGFEANTILEAYDIIDKVIWWTGDFQIVETATDEVVRICHKYDARAELEAIQTAFNAINED